MSAITAAGRSASSAISMKARARDTTCLFHIPLPPGRSLRGGQHDGPARGWEDIVLCLGPIPWGGMGRGRTRGQPLRKRYAERLTLLLLNITKCNS
jgi:hypothetical protein